MAKLTRTQRDFLFLLTQGHRVVYGEYDQYRWAVDGKSCSRTARKLRSLGLIRNVYRTTNIADTQLTQAGMDAISFTEAEQ